MNGRGAMILVMLVMAGVVSGRAVRARKRMHLKMWLYDKMTSPNATGVQVAGPGGDTSKVQFGSLFVIDNQILDGPNFTSAAEIGRAKGTYMLAAVDSSHAFLAFSALLLTPKYNGSIAFQGADKSFGPLSSKEIAVVGGTGSFRSASGYASWSHTYLRIPDSVVLLDTHIVFP